jgi:hypothetical protein
MSDKGWHRAFDDPIPPRNGRQLVTRRDAGARDHVSLALQLVRRETGKE